MTEHDSTPDAGAAGLPRLSIVIPMRDEAAYIGRCLDSFLAQEYPADRLEVLVVDGRSEDGSADIVRGYELRHPGRVRLLDNPRRITPTALNVGLAHADGDIVVIFGAHAYAAPDFALQNALAFERSRADCVGGTIETVGASDWARAIALAMGSPFGVGNARFRYSETEGDVDHVAFAATRRAVFDRVGSFDERFVRNQDDEFSFRVIRAGGRIFHTPAIRATYYSRATIPRLFRQYRDYGYWKVFLMAKHGGVPSARHLVPATFVASALASLLLACRGGRWRLLPALVLGPYAATLAAGTVLVARRAPDAPPAVLARVPVAFATLHASYGLGFWRGLLDLARRRLSGAGW